MTLRVSRSKSPPKSAFPPQVDPRKNYSDHLKAVQDKADRADALQEQLDRLEEGLFTPKFEGEIEIRTMFAYKSSKPPMFNLYRGNMLIAQAIVTKTRARAYAQAERALQNGE